VYTSAVPPAPVVVVVVVALIDLSLSSFLLLVTREKIYTSARAHKRLKTTHPKCNGPALIDRFEEYLATNRILLIENQHFDVVQYWQDRYES
jgi:hypothetical protein